MSRPIHSDMVQLAGILKVPAGGKTVMGMPGTSGMWAFLQLRDMCGEMGEIEKKCFMHYEETPKGRNEGGKK